MFTGIVTAVGEVRSMRPIGAAAAGGVAGTDGAAGAGGAVGVDMRLVIGVPGGDTAAGTGSQRAGPRNAGPQSGGPGTGARGGETPALGEGWPAAVAAGGLLFLAAQGPLDEATGAVVGGGVAAQAEVCLNRLLAVMEAEGDGVGALVRLGVALADPEDAVAVQEVLMASLKRPLPACSVVAAAGLPRGALVQIDGVARHDPGQAGAGTGGAERGFLAGAATGASIACAGCCLTLVEQGPDWFAVEASAETLSLTTLGGWTAGTRLNLERSLRLGDELGGHMVSGHVDGLGRLVSAVPENGSLRLTVRVPGRLLDAIVLKGSVAVDGVSLTVNAVQGDTFGVNIIPHTAAVTTLGRLQPGDAVHIEVDRMARGAAGAAPVAPGPGAPAWT